MTKPRHVSDFRSRKPWFDWVLDHSEEHDLVACTGDLLELFGAESLAIQVGWITARARPLPRPLLGCPGNHGAQTRGAPVSPGQWPGRLTDAKAFSEAG